MKKIKFLSFLLMSVLLLSCSDDENATVNGEMPVADFSFTSDRSTFTFTNLSTGASEYRWDFGDLNFYSYEKDPIYSYDIKGGELTVSLTVSNEAGQEAYASKTIVAPIVINADIVIDGDFDDWEEVPVSIEFPEANLSIKKMKFYTKGPLINIYFEGGTSMTLDVVDMHFNTDEDRETGYTENWAIGSDYLFEGPPVLPTWGSFFSYAGTNGGWGWNPITFDGFETSGVVALDAETNSIEMSIPKSLFGSVGETIDFGMWVNWGAEFYPDPSGDPITIEIQ